MCPNNATARFVASKGLRAQPSLWLFESLAATLLLSYVSNKLLQSLVTVLCCPCKVRACVECLAFAAAVLGCGSGALQANIRQSISHTGCLFEVACILSVHRCVWSGL